MLLCCCPVVLSLNYSLAMFPKGIREKKFTPESQGTNTRVMVTCASSGGIISWYLTSTRVLSYLGTYDSSFPAAAEVGMGSSR